MGVDLCGCQQYGTPLIAAHDFDLFSGVVGGWLREKWVCRTPTSGKSSMSGKQLRRLINGLRATVCLGLLRPLSYNALSAPTRVPTTTTELTHRRLTDHTKLMAVAYARGRDPAPQDASPRCRPLKTKNGIHFWQRFPAR
jgi:hypothetical protein